MKIKSAHLNGEEVKSLMDEDRTSSPGRSDAPLIVARCLFSSSPLIFLSFFFYPSLLPLAFLIFFSCFQDDGWSNPVAHSTNTQMHPQRSPEGQLENKLKVVHKAALQS